MTSPWLAATQSAIQNKLDSFKNVAKGSLGSPNPSPNKKTKKTDGEGAVIASPRGRTMNEEPSSPREGGAETAWYKQALQKSLGCFAEAVDERISSVEQKQVATDETIEELRKELKEVKDAQKNRDEKIQEELSKLALPAEETVKRILKEQVSEMIPNQEQLEELRQASQTVAAEAAAAKAKLAEIPPEHAVTATMGQLGWDLKDEEAVKRCKSTLERCEVSPEWFHDIYCLREDRNSIAFVDFRNNTMLEAASRRLRQHHVKHAGAARQCWLAKKKEDWELTPGKWVRRAEDWLKREYAESEVPLDIKADMRKKVLEAKEPMSEQWTALGGPGRDTWVWFAASHRWLSEQQRDVGAAWIAGR